MADNNENKCPVMHGALTSNNSGGTSNKDWWPNQLNLSILHQHDRKSDPMDEGFDYAEEFKKLDFKALKNRSAPMFPVPKIAMLIFWIIKIPNNIL